MGFLTAVSPKAPPLRAEPPIPPDAFATLRRRAMFDCFKWDPQMEDVQVLAPFALTIDEGTWRHLADAAARLAAEATQAEHEILGRTDLLRKLGLPRAIRQVLSRTGSAQDDRHEGARFCRFDFHPAEEGWVISEANTDVPGGFIEASGLSRLFLPHVPGARVAGDPAEALAHAVRTLVGERAHVLLAHATAYTDDHQVMAFVAERLRERALRASLRSPDALRWESDRACTTDGDTVDAVVRFFPAEWLPNLPRETGWRAFFRSGPTILCNPGSAIIVQSKRFPLVWDDLKTPLPAWRKFLPEVRDVRDVPWQTDEGWVLKPALGRVGDGIGIRGVTSERDWRAIGRSARWHAPYWAAQRRFRPLAVETPEGPYYPCLGVFTVGGRACGIYGRISRIPLIDHRARDVAVLIREEGDDNE